RRGWFAYSFVVVTVVSAPPRRRGGIMRTVPGIGRSRDLGGGIVVVGLLIGGLLSGGLLVGSTASAAVIPVPADHPPLQSAGDAAAAGDIVRVSPGVYPERVRISGARDGLTIEAADPSNPPVIQGKTSTSTDGVQVDGLNGVTLRALRIVNAN